MKYANLTGLFRAFGVAMDERQMAKIRAGKSWEAHSFNGMETGGQDDTIRDRNFYDVSFVVSSYGFFDRLTSYELRFHLSGHDGARENWNIRFHGHDEHGYTVDRVTHEQTGSEHKTTLETWTRHPGLTRLGRVFNALGQVGHSHDHGGHDHDHDHGPNHAGHVDRRLIKLDEDSAPAMLRRIKEFDAYWRGQMYETGRVGVDHRPPKAQKTPQSSKSLKLARRA